MIRAPSLPRTIWLLASVRLRTLMNRMSFVSFNRGKTGAKRSATPRKGRGGLFATLFMGIMLLNSFNLANQAIQRMLRQFYLGVDGEWSTMLSTIIMIITLLGLTIALLPLTAVRQMGQSDWELEWLSTLPVSRTRLLWSRLMERGLFQASGILLLWPEPVNKFV